jgi:hypothetical protein
VSGWLLGGWADQEWWINAQAGGSGCTEHSTVHPLDATCSVLPHPASSTSPCPALAGMCMARMPSPLCFLSSLTSARAPRSSEPCWWRSTRCSAPRQGWPRWPSAGAPLARCGRQTARGPWPSSGKRQLCLHCCAVCLCCASGGTSLPKQHDSCHPQCPAAQPHLPTLCHPPHTCVCRGRKGIGPLALEERMAQYHRLGEEAWVAGGDQDVHFIRVRYSAWGPDGGCSFVLHFEQSRGAATQVVHGTAQHRTLCQCSLCLTGAARLLPPSNAWW